MGSLADHIMLAIPGKGSVNEKLIAFFGGGGTLQPQSTSSSALILKALAGQTGDLLRFEDSNGTLLGRMFPYGHFTAQYFNSLSNSTNHFGEGTVINAALMSLNSTTPTQTLLILRGGVAQTADLQQWQDSAGVVLSKVGPSGDILARTVQGGPVAVGNVGVTASALAATFPALVVKGFSGQTASLQEWQDSVGVILRSITAAGLPKWNLAANQQTTVGATGTATALPTLPVKYLKVVDSAGTTLVVPAYNA